MTVSVRIRPGGNSCWPTERGITVGNMSFGFPKHVIAGSNQADTEVLASNLLDKFLSGGMSCTLMAYG